MARDFQIPFGPDKTNGEGFDPIPPEGASSYDALADQPIDVQASVVDNTSALDYTAASQASASTGGAAVAASAVLPATTPRSFGGRDDDEEPASATLSREEATAQGMDDVQMSFAALRDSIGQGRELKAREKELDELSEALDADYEELADRENILANFNQVVGEQDAIIAEHTERRDARKAELAQMSAQLDETTEALERMRDYHATQIQPIETELGQARAAADRAKNDERSRKAELSATEKELSRANDSDANTMVIAQHQQTQAAYEDARRISDQAKERLAQVQRTYDDARAQIEQAEGPLERSIADLTQHSEELKEEINQLGEEISAARKRRQYCEMVYQYPEETDRMRSEVAHAEEVARQMDAENEVLREQLAESKQKSKKAKVAIGILIVIVVVFIIAMIIVSNR